MCHVQLLLCCGDFFGAGGAGASASEWTQHLDGSARAAVSSLILGPSAVHLCKYYASTSPSGGELCDQVTHLGKAGVYVTASGLSIVYLSGTEQSRPSRPRPLVKSKLSGMVVTASASAAAGADSAEIAKSANGSAKSSKREGESALSTATGADPFEMVHFTKSDVDKLLSSLPSEGVDILLTYQWPAGVETYCPTSIDPTQVHLPLLSNY